MKSGIYYELPGDQYHSGPGISNSGLGLIARSPLHYWSKYLDPNREPEEPTPALELGTAVHCAILEPEEFSKRYKVAPDVDRRTKAGKELYEAFLAELGDAKAISEKDFRRCQMMAESMHRHDAAEIIFAGGKAEVSIFWEDEETGVLCKIRPDWLMHRSTSIFDLKTTEDASPRSFERSIMNYGYFRQAAFYLDGARAAGLEVDAFLFGAIEKSAPFASAIYYAEGTMIEAGRAEYRRHLRTYAECLERDRWPGYPSEIVPIGLPAWFKPEAANDNSPT